MYIWAKARVLRQNLTKARTSPKPVNGKGKKIKQDTSKGFFYSFHLWKDQEKGKGEHEESWMWDISKGLQGQPNSKESR